MDEPVVAPSAHRHGVDDQTILHAFNNPIRVLVGPDQAGNLYEIGVVASTDGPVIVHAMPARPKYLR